MSSLKERLGRLKKTADTAVDSASTAVLVSETLGASWERLGAKMHHNDWGQFIIRRLRYPFDHMHGKYRLGELCGEAGPLSALGAVAKKRGSRKGSGRGRNGSFAAENQTADPLALPPVSHERLLFLDTETTGLGVGAGNVAFMVGIGFYDPDAFVVEQLFIRNPAEEAAMLHHLRERLTDRDMLVSYNGKCFDWPVLKNRYILNRQKDGATDPVHFDFLYPSRSLWRNTLPSCRLSSVERERLGLSRIDDVPGSLAPALYFQYLAENDPTLVAGVFEHNEKDVLTLACLAIHLTRLMTGTVPRERMEPEELFRLALWLDKLGRAEEADEVFRELLGLESEQAADYLLPAAEFYKGQGRFGPAISLWERAIERKRRSRIAPLTPYVELAMYYEHQQKDYDRALLYAEQAFEKARGRISAARKEGSGAEELEAIRKRVERLKAKRDSARKRKDMRKPVAGAANKGGKRYGSEWTAGIWQQTLTFSGEDIRSGERSERRTETL
ncbi:hypothetical protein FE783_12025 [Paenibacillus mesophilus]|uniref:ribonuclease H-like domain-containing protein n=1 Tax=Paenibacillus mesophilus TaxID=2582849 RepID=UPI00110F40EA|nr:ribonuclease H-like domain-containing protein [Paenibacillus mesophilus]TMV50274.1 hypothetical protein FE783_12025 [Paenibacillus mesophilus]